MMRIVLDTNCLLQILPKRSPWHTVWERICDGSISLCVSEEILLEYEEILARKTSPAVASGAVNRIKALSHTIYAEPFFRFNLITSDPDDNKFVDVCLAAGAMFLVSDDQHFAVLNTIEFPRVTVLTLPGFCALQEFRTSY